MKAIIEFNLPEDQSELNVAMGAQQLYSFVHDIDQRLRSILKHGGGPETVQALAEEIREQIHEDVGHILFKE